MRDVKLFEKLRKLGVGGFKVKVESVFGVG